MAKIWISTGSSRFEKSWKNKEVEWAVLLAKLQKPVITKETIAEYLKMGKDDQGAIKDVGGFVGGVVAGSRRKQGSISGRYMLTLDVDHAGLDFFDDVCMLYGCEMALYSTHKHTESAPRYRLVVPLSREVMADEHEAIARRVASVIGIDLFDSTTFQAERLMYWPSVSVDGKWEYRRQEGEWLDADAVLGEYDDWTDTAEWAGVEKIRKQKEVDKQEDPALKGGLIGVFCRVYGVEAVIERYLGEVYEQCGDSDRWTYREGSTSGGMLVYDDKWTFSHHSTDPTQGRLCNAFDLVRIHLFGSEEDSEGKMLSLVGEDNEVKKEIVGVDEEWVTGLEMDKKGIVLSTIDNIVRILENDEKLKNSLGYDDLNKLDRVRRDLPWRKISRYNRVLTDHDEVEFRYYLELVYGIVNRDKIRDAIDVVVHKNVFHPVIDYLKSIVWDGRERVDRLLVDVLGAEDTAYTREVTRKTLVAAVSRVFQPGIKFDTILVLVGPQGIGKSRLIAKLGGEWYSDTFGSLQNKDAMEQIQGVWLMEIGELAGLKKQEVETIKLFISKQEDRFRVAYGRKVETYARQCVFIGTTNDQAFLQDPSGNRRFWPIQCGSEKGDLDGLNVDQVWAECCHLYTMGEDLFLEDETEAKKVQTSYTEHDDRAKMIEDYVNMMVPVNWYELNIFDRQAFIVGDETIGVGAMQRDYITIPEIWLELMKGYAKDMTTHNVKYIRNIMNKVEGWKPKMLNKKNIGYQRGWIREGGIVATLL